MLGQRDEAWRQRFNVGTLGDCGVWSAPLAGVADDPADTGRRAISHLAQHADRWWLHVDLDVLDPVEFPAQGLPGVEDEPGGLTWVELTALAAAMLDAGGCVGCSIAIYDPDQDPDGTGAAQIVQFAREVFDRYRTSR